MQCRNTSVNTSRAKAIATHQNNTKRFALVSTTAFFAILFFLMF